MHIFLKHAFSAGFASFFCVVLCFRSILIVSAIVKKHDFVLKVTDMTPHMVEEYVLETPERGASRIYHTRLTIYQRLANDEYLGELYVERDYKEGDNKGSTCRFEQNLVLYEAGVISRVGDYDFISD